MNTSIPNLTFQSISQAALGSTIKPEALTDWISQVNEQVRSRGKFTKGKVAYIPFSPPPFFWDYKCKKCRFFRFPNSCTVVEGDISPRGWCAIWLPLDNKRPFSWPKDLVKGNW